MAKAFSVLSWNVEHFKGEAARLRRVVDAVAAENPDIFALYEVKASRVFEQLTIKMPDYSFHITEGRQIQEILIGVKSRFTAFFTQRIEFKTGNTYLRPGAFLTVTVDGENYGLLFLHLKSNDKPIGFGIRDEQIAKIWRLKRALDRNASGGAANFIAMGDLNIMGMSYPGPHDISEEVERFQLARRAALRSNRMRLLSKTAAATFSNGPSSSVPKSDLDHVLAADHLQFKSFAAKPLPDGETVNVSRADVDVRGWVDETTNARWARWIRDFSDHGYLFFEVQKN